MAGSGPAIKGSDTAQKGPKIPEIENSALDTFPYLMN
jgi:hypothetical protein